MADKHFAAQFHTLLLYILYVMLLMSEEARWCLQQPSIFIFWESFQMVNLEDCTYHTAPSFISASPQPVLFVWRLQFVCDCFTDVLWLCSLLLNVLCLISSCWVFKCYRFWVLFSGQKGDYACSKSLYSFTPTGSIDMGTISCTMSSLSQLHLSFCVLCDMWLICFVTMMGLSEITSRCFVLFLFSWMFYPELQIFRH